MVYKNILQFAKAYDESIDSSGYDRIQDTAERFSAIIGIDDSNFDGDGLADFDGLTVAELGACYDRYYCEHATDDNADLTFEEFVYNNGLEDRVIFPYF